MQRPVSSSHARTTISGRKTPLRNKARSIGQQQEAVTAYISDMSAQLARMAGEAQLPMLAYFLNLARVEADMSLRKRQDGEN